MEVVETLTVDNAVQVVIPAMMCMLETHTYKDVVPDVGYVAPLISKMAANPNSFIMLADFKGSTVNGVMLGTVSNLWYQPTVRASAEFLFVHERARGGSCMLRLIRAFERKAKDMGANEVLLGCSNSNTPMYRYAKCMNRLGYSNHSVTFKRML